MAALLLAASLSARALTPPTVVLAESTKPIDAAPAAGATKPTRPFIARQALTSAEASAPITFEVALKMRDFAALRERVGRREHISAKEMAEKYEPSAADYQKVVDWLQGQGFTIVRRDSHHMAVFVRGKVGDVAHALKVDFARVTSNGKDYTSAVTAPTVPADISPLLTGINGLQPHLRAHSHLLKPQAGTNAAPGVVSYLPSQMAQAYGAASLYNSNIKGGGQTIAIVISTFPSTTDLLLFWKNGGVNQSISNMEFVQVVPGSLPSPIDVTNGGRDESEEATLDVEWSSAMAPQAHIRVYATTTLDNTFLDMAYQAVLDDATNHPELGLHQMSMSYGEGETYTTQGQVDTDSQYFAELTAAGVTCFASSGDGGASPGPSGGGDKSGPVQAESPASDPNVVGVGGTTLTLDGNNNTSNEVVWNNSSGASGGGNSIYFARPSWQTGTGVPAGTKRVVPDISGPADPNFGATVYFQGVQTTFGGTSWACPMLAGFCALINQAHTDAGQPSGNEFGPGLYPLLNSADYAASIHDITSGTNTTHNNNGFAATVGYDRSTGVGSPKLGALTPTSIGGGTPVGVQMPAAMASLTPGQTGIFTVAVGGDSAAYQWQRLPVGSSTWGDLGDSGAYTGSTAASLTVSPATAAMSGDLFRCVITLGSNQAVTTTPSALIVESPLIISTLAGSAGTSALADGTGAAAHFAIPSGVAIDGSGNLFIADFNNNAIREVTPAGVVTTPYGSTTGVLGSSNGSGNVARFSAPNGVAFDLSHGPSILYVADTGNNSIRKIVGGVVSTFTSAMFNSPEGVAVDGSGNVYVADTFNQTIRKITSAGVVSTLAGQTGTAGFRDGAATSALFNNPSAVAVDSSGNVYVADFSNSVVRKISGGTVSTIAGRPGVAGYLDGPGSTALFNTPSGVTVDAAGNVYVADCLVPALTTTGAGNNLVRRISTTGVVSTLAGQAGNEGTADGIGQAASFYSLQALAVSPMTGTFYFADTYNQTIRQGVVLAPLTLSITATQPLATVFNSVPGVFTVTRIGGDASTGVTANYQVGGSAVPGTDYTPTLPGTLTIPVGETAALITVTPLGNGAATGNPTLTLSLSGTSGYSIGSSSSATVTIEEITSFQTWSATTFGSDAADPSIAGPAADPNNNGVPNLLEFAFGSNPLQTGTEPLPTVTTSPGTDGLDHLEVTFNQLSSGSGLTYTVQVSSDLVTWNSGPAYTTVVSQTPNGSGIAQVTVMDNAAVSTGDKRFIRVQVGGN